ncbi:MAG: RagB/SusD family nutrient uptake outer membrane protein [Puia sp.]|nr:RagB/SusD family nutrient uptake outer membrane protein [Puia sp.]
MYLQIDKIKVLISSICFSSVMSSCTKFVQIEPPTTSITGSTVYSNNTSAAAAVTSIYNNMMATQGLSGGINSISYLDGLEADELKNYTNDNLTLIQFYTNSLTSSSNGGSNNYFWQELYQEIYVTNAVMEGLNNSTTLSDSIKQQLYGEAEFMRAFFNFYAVNLYGDVPLVTTTNYQVNNTIKRTPSTQIYQQIISDLKDAQNKLNSSFVDYQGLSTPERIRPNKGAATALLARAYLYQQKWDSAMAQATLLINNPQYSIVNLTNVFLANSNETIWQLQPVAPGYNTYDAQYFVLTSAPGTGTNYVALGANLLNSFEPNDQRFINWVGTFIDPSSNDTFYFPYKYKVYLNPKPVTEYLMVLRLGEQYLIRAEAEANGAGNGIADAISDLNVIRTRSSLPPYSGATDQASVQTAIMHERQIELFTEWGHRWFDLKRTRSIDSVMGPPGYVCRDKGGTWSPNWELMPLPLNELEVNPNLKQNLGY